MPFSDSSNSKRRAGSARRNSSGCHWRLVRQCLNHIARHSSGQAMLSLAAIVVLCTGCAHRPDCLTRDNYRRIQVQASTEDDVRSALGEPTTILGNQWHYARDDQHLNCFIDFDDQGRVTRTQWIDAMTNTWHDTSETKSK
jgi:hypothetical protein